MIANLSIYLAGPDVFRPDADAIGARLKTYCDNNGVLGLWPGDTKTPEGCRTPQQAAGMIQLTNAMLIKSCDAVVANVTPFRGPHLDAGTAFEIGYAAAFRKPIFVYRNSTELPLLINRIWCEEQDDGSWRDAKGDLVEDFGLFDNLMIACAVKGDVAGSAEEAIARCAQELHQQHMRMAGAA